MLPLLLGASPQSFVFSGRIVEPDGTPLEASNVVFTLEIRSPGPENCLLYTESHVRNMSVSEGFFQLPVGSSAADRTGGAGPEFSNNLSEVLNNTHSGFAGHNCDMGNTYTPSAGHTRKIKLIFDDGINISSLDQALSIHSVPYAEHAYSVGGKSLSELLQVNTPGDLTQSNVEWVFSNFTELQSLLNGTSLQYSTRNSNGANQLPSFATASPPASPAAGDIWYDSDSGFIKYHTGSSTETIGTVASSGTVTDITIGSGLVDGAGDPGGTITTSGTIALPTVVASGTYSKVTVDDYGRVTLGAALSESDIPALTVAGNGVDGGAITAGTIGGSTAINTSGNLTTSGTVTGSAFSGRSYVLWDSDDSNSITINPPATGVLTSDYNLVLPSTPGTGGEVLATDGSGNLSWSDVSSPLVGNIQSGAGEYFSYMPNNVECGEGEVLKWQTATNRWACGTDSNTDAVTSVFGRSGLVVAQSGDYSAGQVTNTASGGVAATTVQAAINELDTDKQNASAELSGVSGLTGMGFVERTGAGTYTTHSVTAAGKALLDDADAGSQRISLGLGTIATQDANLVAITGGAIDGSAIGSTTPSTGNFTSVSSTGGVSGSAFSGRSYILWDSDDSNSITINAPNTGTLTSDYTLVLPPTAGTAGYALITDGSGNLSWVDISKGAGDYRASDITNVAAGNIAATHVQAAINELDSEKQPLSTELTGVAGLSTSGIIERTGAGAYSTIGKGGSLGEIPQVTTVLNTDALVHWNNTAGGLEPFVCAAGEYLQYTGTIWSCVDSATDTTAFHNGGDSFGAPATLGTNDASDLHFETNNTRRVSVLANGNVGIGTTSPAGKLHVSSKGTAILLRPPSLTVAEKTSVVFSDPDSGSPEMSIDYTDVGDDGSLSINGGFVGIGTSTPNAQLTLEGALSLDHLAVDPAGTTGYGALYTKSDGKLYYRDGVGSIVDLTGFGSGDGDFMADGSIAMTGSFKATSGTAAVPGMSFATDQDTGIYNSVADNLMFSTGANERMRITSSGNVGIGTATPATALQVAGQILGNQVNSPQYYVNGSTGLISSGTDLRIGNGSLWTDTSIYAGSGNELIRLKSSGLVGVGTNNPASKLHVSGGDVQVGEPAMTSGNPTFSIYGYDSAATTARYGHLKIESDGSFKVAAEDGYLILSSGNYIQSNNIHNFLNSILFNGDTNLYRHSADYLRTNDNFLVDGNMGIGTTTPNAKLTVNGAVSLDHMTADPAGTAGYGALYTKSDGKLYYRDGVGSIVDLTGFGSGDGDFMADGSVAMTGAFRGLAGSASGPGMSFSGDTDTGAYSPAADAFAITTGGTEKLRVDASGNVGIGTSSPDSLFQVNQSSASQVQMKVSNPNGANGARAALKIAADTAQIDILSYSSGYTGNYSGISRSNGVALRSASGSPADNMFIGTGSASPLHFMTGDSVRMSVASNGNVGIGTSTPSKLLDVDGHFRVGEGSDQGLIESAYVGNGISLNIYDYDDPVAIRFRNSPTTDNPDIPEFENYISGNLGRIGVGTLYPDVFFDVNGNANFGNSSENSAEIRLHGDNFSWYGWYLKDTRTAFIESSASAFSIHSETANIPMVFSTSAAEGMRIAGNGNIGMGTSSPSQKLHVVGNLRVQGSTDCTLGNGSGGTNCSSDRRLKSEIKPIENPLTKILALNGVDFEWNGLASTPGRKDIGVIAQDVEEQFPTAVIEGEDGYKRVDYAVLVAPLIEAVKEVWQKLVAQDEKIETTREELLEENQKLRGQLEALTKRVEALEQN